MGQSAPDPISNLQAMTGDLSPEILAALGPYYTGQQQLRQPQQQSLGVGWDQPVFNQQPQSSNSIPQLPSRTVPSHPLQSWQPMTEDFATQQRYGQEQGYTPSAQVAYQSPYSFPEGLYSSHQLSGSNSLPPQAPQRNIQPWVPQPMSYEPVTRSTSVSQYTAPVYLPSDLTKVSYQIEFILGFLANQEQPTQVGARSGLSGSSANASDQQTVNPQFLGPTSQPTSTHQSPSIQNTFLYMTPADFQGKSSGG